MSTGLTLILFLQLGIVGFPEPPEQVPKGYLETVVWTSADSSLHGQLDSMTVDLAVLASNPNTSPGEVMELIGFIQDVDSDSGSAAALRRDILLNNARSIYNQILSRLEELPSDASPEALMFELTESDPNDATDSLESNDEDDSTAATFGARISSAKSNLLPPIPMVLNRDVQHAISYFQTRARKVVQKWLDRSASVIPELLPFIREEGLPDEIIYLAMIESGFNYHAKSYAKAVGPWQFIKGTGKRYGLKINNWYDERRDPELSTRAAAAYLRDLYYMFGDWYLAMASYNCGEGKVLKHVRKYGDNYWLLSRLPKQTRGYVPSYIAARMIAETPEIYGFWMPRRMKPEPTDVVDITACVELKALAECAGIDLETFQRLNPALLRSTTPPGGDSTLIRLPGGTIANGFWELYADLPMAKKSDLLTHRVKRGESLGSIASAYGVPVDVIAEYPENQIGKRYLIREGQTILIPASLETPAPKRRMPQIEIVDKSGAHVVRSGETLVGIARNNRIPLERLAALNGLTTVSTIFPGQVLKLEGVPPTEMAINRESNERRHIVNSGDTLWAIARQYGVTVEGIRRVNGLKNESVLKPGQTLAIPSIN